MNRIACFLAFKLYSIKRKGLSDTSSRENGYQALPKTETKETGVLLSSSFLKNSPYFVETLGYFKVNQTKEVTVKYPRD